MIHALAALLALSPAPASTAVPPIQDDELPVEWLDIRQLITARSESPDFVDMRLPMISSHLDALEPEATDVPLPEDVLFTIDRCFDAVERSVDADPQATLGSLKIVHGRLRVTGNDRARSIARRTVDSLTALASDRASVDIIRVPSDVAAAVSGCILSPDEADTLVMGAGSAAAETRSVPFGRRAIFGSERTYSFLADYDVEVAQAAMAADASVSVLRSGLRVGIRLDRAADGQRTVVRAWGRDVKIQNVRRRAIDGFGGAELELPQVGTAMLMASGIVESGGALLVRCGEQGGDILIRVRPESSGVASEAVILGEHLLGRMRRDPIHIPAASPSQGWNHDKSNFAEATAPWHGDGVRPDEFVDEVLGQRRASQALIPFGSLALFVGADDDRSALRTAFDEYAAAAPAYTFSVEAAHGIVDGKTAAALMASRDFTAFAAADGTTHMRGPVLEGDTMLLLDGKDAAYLQDFDVQIAGGSTIEDPIVRSVFWGSGLWLSPIAATEDGGLSAWVDVRRQKVGGGFRELPISRYDIEFPTGSDAYPVSSGTHKTDLSVELPETRQASTRGRVSLEPGRWQLICSQPMAGSEGTFVMIARAQAIR